MKTTSLGNGKAPQGSCHIKKPLNYTLGDVVWFLGLYCVEPGVESLLTLDSLWFSSLTAGCSDFCQYCFIHVRKTHWFSSWAWILSSDQPISCTCVMREYKLCELALLYWSGFQEELLHCSPSRITSGSSWFGAVPCGYSAATAMQMTARQSLAGSMGYEYWQDHKATRLHTLDTSLFQKL